MSRTNTPSNEEVDKDHSEEDNFDQEDLIDNGERGETELSKLQSDFNDNDDEVESSEIPSATLQLLDEP
jgi:hypothetical protein